MRLDKSLLYCVQPKLMAPIIDFRVRRWCRCRLSRQMIGVHARSHMTRLQRFCQDGVGTLVSFDCPGEPVRGSMTRFFLDSFIPALFQLHTVEN